MGCLLRASQQEDDDPDTELLQLEAATAARSNGQGQIEARSSGLDGSNRWIGVRENPIITNQNTAKQTRLAINTFIAYLKEAKTSSLLQRTLRASHKILWCNTSRHMLCRLQPLATPWMVCRTACMGAGLYICVSAMSRHASTACLHPFLLSPARTQSTTLMIMYRLCMPVTVLMIS